MHLTDRRYHHCTIEQVDACMVATGRVPMTKSLGLEEMGIETFRGFVQVRWCWCCLFVPD